MSAGTQKWKFKLAQVERSNCRTEPESGSQKAALSRRAACRRDATLQAIYV